jgi:hypothetical protein
LPEPFAPSSDALAGWNRSVTSASAPPRRNGRLPD